MDMVVEYAVDYEVVGGSDFLAVVGGYAESCLRGYVYGGLEGAYGVFVSFGLLNAEEVLSQTVDLGLPECLDRTVVEQGVSSYGAVTEVVFGVVVGSDHESAPGFGKVVEVYHPESGFDVARPLALHQGIRRVSGFGYGDGPGLGADVEYGEVVTEGAAYHIRVVEFLACSCFRWHGYADEGEVPAF